MATILNEFTIAEKHEQNDYTMVVSNPIYAKVTTTKDNLKKVLSHAYMSIKTTAYACYKSDAYLETTDIDNIKKALNSKKETDMKVIQFKENLTADLDCFQNKIKINHTKKINNLIEEKRNYEKQLEALKGEKQQILSDGFSKFMCIFTTRSKDLESKIESAQVQIQNCIDKIEELEHSTPTATEKDVILYQRHLKEKYAKLFE